VSKGSQLKRRKKEGRKSEIEKEKEVIEEGRGSIELGKGKRGMENKK
jgi:hypothetical protein